MPQDNQLSPLFGHMQDTPPGDVTPTPQEVSDKTSTILEGFATTPEPVSPVSDSAFGAAVPTTTITPMGDVSLPEIPASSLEPAPTSIPASSVFGSATPVVPEAPSVPVPSLSETSSSPTIEPEAEVSPMKMVESDAVVPAEKIEESAVPPVIPVKKETSLPDSKLEQYLQADQVYQDMIRTENQEKIRLRLAIRYTLLMFVIFLVLAWIVSNRVIMFGFSEFVWLARIRDALFAVMAGLFGLTLWFGSVSWTHNTSVIALIRTLAIIFFGSVIIALYIPF